MFSVHIDDPHLLGSRNDEISFFHMIMYHVGDDFSDKLCTVLLFLWLIYAMDM